MKKHLFVLPLLVSSLLLGGCPSNLTTQTKIEFGSYQDTTLRVINHAKLDEMVTNYNSFILVVSPEHQSCMCWHDFKNILEEYIQEEHMIVYEINYKDFFDIEGNQLTTHGIEIHASEETFTIFNEGKLVKHEIYNAKNSIFKQKQAFFKYMNEAIIKPNMYYIDLVKLDELYQSGKEEVIYFSRSNCPDCQYVDKYFLKDYDFKDKTMYVVDCETIGVREYDEHGSLTPTSQEEWAKFKEDYGMAKKYNEEMGYDAGYVPTFQLLKGNGEHYYSSILASSVYFNDSVSVIDDKYYITNTFYTEERCQVQPYLDSSNVLMNKELNENEVISYEKDGVKKAAFNKPSAAIYHDPLLKAFLDYAFDKVA